MKKILAFTLTALTLLTCSCENNKAETTTAKSTVETTAFETTAVTEATEPMNFIFLSGAGGWSTEMTLNADGSFSGEYHDSELGSIGDNYPNGTVYTCKFTGKFKDFEKVNEYTYSMSIDTINTEYEIGKTWIEDGVQYIAGAPYGLDGGNDFLLYTPDAPTAELPEDFIIWIKSATEVKDTLGCYAIRNLANDCGFAESK